MTRWSEPVSKDALEHALNEIDTRLPGTIDRRQDVRDRHANTWTWIVPQPPDAVAYPKSTADVCELVRIAGRHRVPIIPYGGGTSLEGHVNAPFGGISVDMACMDHIGPLHIRDFAVRVQSGVRLADLNQFLEHTPVFFSVDPGAGEATLGGLAATRASGTNTVRYGTMRENVIALEVVLSDGTVIETATAAPKSAAGYDLTHLMIGSEGTLGLITGLTVRLQPRPQSSAVAVVPFPSVAAACQMVMDVLGSGMRPARIELLDGLMIETVNVHSDTGLQNVPTLFLEVHGPGQDVENAQGTLRKISTPYGVSDIQFSCDPATRKTLWQARHDAFRALATRWPGQTVLATDVCVPVSNLANAIDAAQAEIAQLDLVAPIVGHVGDGNFHVLPVFDAESDTARTCVQRLLDRLVDIAHAHHGTCTGEHGIGQGKKDFLAREAGQGIEAMKAIKAALDPLDILNPGKLF